VYVAMRGDRGTREFAAFGDKIAIVDVEGVILDPRGVVEQLKRYGDDGSIKAIILRVNTPGGGAAASEEIYASVKRIREQKKKRIVASIETLGASGGYYVAAGTDKIFANQSSIVGSIGVIAQWVNYAELMRWAKMKDVTLTAGEFKDTGSPTREMGASSGRWRRDASWKSPGFASWRTGRSGRARRRWSLSWWTRSATSRRRWTTPRNQSGSRGSRC
jgi:protease-4